MLKNKKYWFFDMDGTLTRAVHDFNAIRKTLKLPDGAPILETIAELEEDKARRLLKQLDMIEEDLVSQATAQPGAYEFLDLLHRQQLFLGIITRNSKKIAIKTLEQCGLNIFFSERYILGRDCCKPKPHGDGIIKLMHLWEAEPMQCVMVGDYLYDLLTGRNAGIDTVHFDVTGKFPWPEYTDFKIHDYSELIRYWQENA